jgi:hypothetical protein
MYLSRLGTDTMKYITTIVFLPSLGQFCAAKFTRPAGSRRCYLIIYTQDPCQFEQFCGIAEHDDYLLRGRLRPL